MLTLFKKINFFYTIAGLFLLAGIININSTGWAKPLAVGTKAPNFTLKANDGKIVALSDYKKSYLIVVFYPKDNTPGCTIQLCSLRDTHSQLKQLNINVVAINPETLASHQKFAKKQNYLFPLASDPGNHIAKAFGVNSMLGLVNQRTVFVISPEGKVIFCEEGMPTPETLMAAVKNHRKQSLKPVPSRLKINDKKP